MQVNGNALRLIREHAGLNLADLSKAAGVSESRICELQRPGSKARPATVKRLADALNVQVSSLAAEPLPVAVAS